MQYRLASIVLLVACGRMGFEPTDETGDDGAGDAAPVVEATATFGGAYLYDDYMTGCDEPNPLAAGTCECPPGFTSGVAMTDDYQTDSGGVYGWSMVRVCSRQPRSDSTYAGSYTVGDGSTHCPSHTNEVTGDMSCPTGTTSLTVQSGGSECPSQWTVCFGPLAVGGTFGGLFVDAACVVPNPFTGGCSCPAGFKRYRLGWQSSLYACMP